jgi:hypothetical protein
VVERHTHWARIIKDIRVPVEGSKLCLVWAERCHPPPQLSLASLALSTYLSVLIGWSLTLSYSSKLNGYLYHQRVSPLKKRPDTLSEGNAATPDGFDSPLQIVIAVWHNFF